MSKMRLFGWQLVLAASLLLPSYTNGQDKPDQAASDQASATTPSGLKVMVNGVWEPVYKPGNGITPPQKLSGSSPEYSDEARRKGIAGTVVLAMTVTSEGKVTQVQVRKSLGYGLDEKAIEAVKQWKFKPAMKDGSPVSVQVAFETSFNQRTAH
jgi:TonB family protein